MMRGLYSVDDFALMVKLGVGAPERGDPQKVLVSWKLAMAELPPVCLTAAPDAT